MKRLALLSVSFLAMCGLPSLAQAATTDVGVTAAVNPTATGQAAGRVRTLVLGAKIVFREKIDTSGEGLVQVLFTDGSTITVGPNASLLIDEYVYDPNAGTGKITATIGKGALRFIGGKISKNSNAVNINTVVGTVGIRGGMADMAVTDQKSVFSLLYGKELTFKGANGQSDRVYQAGYSLQISGAGAGAGQIRPTTAADASFVQNQLTGKSGYSGGAKQKPTNETVEKSDVPGVNSDQSLAENTPPSTDTLPDPNDILDKANGIIEDSTQDTIDNEIDKEEEAEIKFRALSAAEEFKLSTGVIIENPGALGLVGGSSSADQVVIGQPSGNQLTATIQGQQVTLPFTRDPGTLDIDVTVPGFGSVTGSLFVGSNSEFFFYSLFPNSNLNNPIYAFGGTATPASGLLGKDQLLTYELGADPRQGIALPFTKAELVPNADLAAVSKLFVMTPNNVQIGDQSNGQTTGRSTVLLGGLLIQGQGASQNSAAVLLASGFSNDGGGPSLEGGRRGGVRTASTDGSVSFGGGVRSLAGPDGNNLFGANGNNFVLSNDFQNGDAFFDNPYRNNGTSVEENVFGTIHVANQVGAQSQGTLTRSTHTYNGFAAGMLEWRSGEFNPDTDSGNIIPYRSASNSLTIKFDADRDTIGGKFQLNDVTGRDSVDYYQIAFGYDEVTGGLRGVYIDDDRYGARDSNNLNETFVVHDDGTKTTAGSDGDLPKTYLMGSELAQQTGFFPKNVKPCECKFLEWGYWGTQVDWDRADQEGAQFQDFFHLGTWVAGDITPDVDMPQTGTATFNGHAVGNVARNIDGKTNQYLAAGKFDMTWNFGQREGTASIKNFDGMNASGKMNSTVLNPSRFGGGLAGSGVKGNLLGAFVNGPKGPAQGVIGNFDLSGNGVMATGIVAAGRRGAGAN